jgi:hypothetical protein
MAAVKKSNRTRAKKMSAAEEQLRTDLRFFFELLTGVALLVLCLPLSCAGGQVETRPDLVARPSTDAPTANRVSSFEFRQYPSLHELITDVCQDAGRFFSDFYSQTPVTVQPFVFLTGSGGKRLSPMGATLADQMTAMVNNQQGTVVVSGPAKQELKGVLIELDGYLRIHMSGINALDQRRSYTAQVEMTEALYRSLYVDSF